MSTRSRASVQRIPGDLTTSAVEEARTRIRAEETQAALGRLYGLLGEAELARAQYRAALAARPAEITLLRAAAELTIAAGPVREADGYLLRIIEKQSVAPEQAAWARRSLAVLLASTGDPRQIGKLPLGDQAVKFLQ